MMPPVMLTRRLRRYARRNRYSRSQTAAYVARALADKTAQANSRKAPDGPA